MNSVSMRLEDLDSGIHSIWREEYKGLQAAHLSGREPILVGTSCVEESHVPFPRALSPEEDELHQG